jgi:DNA-binding NtrC family response regulator
MELGYRVLEADSATSALEVLQNNKVDLLFTDIIIAGGKTGFDLARIARSRWPGLKVVYTSGFPDTKLATGSGPTTSAKILSKPFRKGELAAAIREAFQGS